MPYNGSGTFNLIYNWEADRDAGIPISAPRMDAQEADIASGLGNCLTRDNQIKPTTTMDWNAQRITNMAPGTLGNDAVNMRQLNQKCVPFNLLANGDFRIWQRTGWSLGGLTTAASVAGGQYMADRWFTRRTTSTAYSLVQVNTSNSTLPCRTGVTIRRTAADANLEPITIAQSILQSDLLNALAWALNNNPGGGGGVGNYLAFTAFLAKGANFSGTDVKMELMYSTNADINAITGAGWTSVGITTVTAASLSAAPLGARFGLSVDWSLIPSTARSLCVRVYYTPTGVAGADDSFFLTGAQLVCTTTPWDASTLNIGQAFPFIAETMVENLQRCRYFFRTSTSPDTATIDGISPGYVFPGLTSSLNNGRASMIWDVPMRNSPTLAIFRTSVSATAGQPGYWTGAAWQNASGVTTLFSGTGGFTVDFVVARAADLPISVAFHWTASAEY